MAYAEIIGGATATELPDGEPFSLSTGEQFAANWLALSLQAEREALNIYPITDDAAPGIEYIVTGSTLEVGGGGVTVQRHWTTTAKTAFDFEAEIDVIREAKLLELSFSDIAVVNAAGEIYTGFVTHNWYPSGQPTQTAILAYGAKALTAIEGSATPGDMAWCPGIASFVWRDVRGNDVPRDAFEMRDVLDALTDYTRTLSDKNVEFANLGFALKTANDIPGLVALHADVQVEANWYVAPI